MSRLTTSTTEGVGHYFPAFLPDGKLFYISNAVPQAEHASRSGSTLTRRRPGRPRRRVPSVFTSPARREAADAIGELWRQTCAPSPDAVPAAGSGVGVSQPVARRSARQLVDERWLPATDARKAALLAACDAR